jgi:hypothetical protein
MASRPLNYFYTFPKEIQLALSVMRSPKVLIYFCMNSIFGVRIEQQKQQLTGQEVSVVREKTEKK